MAHAKQKIWCEYVKKKFPEYFLEKRVLDVGALDVNGNNKYLFEKCEYTGIDVVKGKNVDVVSIAHEYNPGILFDVVLSTNSLEHDMHYKLTLKKMLELLKPGGLMFFSAANTWHEHGTKNKNPHGSGTSKLKGKWANYYKNLEKTDITNTLNLQEVFSDCILRVHYLDLVFWGIKNDT